jgi:hypothetical protein
MSVSSEVQRTLVKSPPELWAELSDPVTLARHLGELGEIHILRTEPERTVDWEAAGADGTGVSGRVEIEPSGWGTRVTLSASHAIAVPEPAENEAEAVSEPERIEVEPEPAAEPEPVAESEPPEAIEAASEPSKTSEPGVVEPETITPSSESAPAPAPRSEIEVVEPEPRPGFFARLFRRRRNEPLIEPAPELTVEPEPVAELEPAAAIGIEEPAPEETTPALEEPMLADTPPEEPAREGDASEPSIAAELAELEEQTTAVLTGVLDRLGAAHHRPFSRA